MHSDDAYNLILTALASDREIKIIGHFLDSENFGNFAISFERMGRRRMLTNDRGQLILDYGRRNVSRLIVESIYEADERDLLEALQRRHD